MRAGIAAIAALVLMSAPASAQKIVEPEQCILDTLKGSASKDATYIVQINCVRQYLRAVDGIAIDVPPASFAGSTLAHYPSMGAIPTAIPERVVVQLKNDSEMLIIYTDIAMTNKKTKVRHVFRGTADFPIAPHMVGAVTATINLGLPNIDDWTWGFERVKGVAYRN